MVIRTDKGKGRHGDVGKGVVIAIASVVAVLVLLKAINLFFPGIEAFLRSVAVQYGLFGSFAVVLLGSTILPFSVDLFFLSAVSLYPDPVVFTAVAVVAAFIGGFVNYVLAFVLSEKWVEKQVGEATLSEAKRWFNAYGGWAIVVFGVIPLSPVIDPLTFVAGLMEMDWRRFALYSLAARVLHFVGLALLALGVVRF